MQKTSKENREDDNGDDNVSAFYEVKPRPSSSSKRDSGYMTDNSPANFNHQLVFDFEESFEDISEDRGIDDDKKEDISDQEVEMVLSQSPSCDGSVMRSESLAVPPRPQAPLPRAATMDLLTDVNNEESEEGDNEVFEHVSATRRYTVYACDRPNPRRRGLCYFRPISSRAIATQTPNPHSQIIQDAMDRFHPYQTSPSRVGACAARIRHFSEGEDQGPSTSSPLPDLVPQGQRDRSVSLPDVPLLRQQREVAVGRELRRISDEFHLSYVSGRVRRHSEFTGPGSLPSTSRFSFTDLWQSLRQAFSSSSPIITRDRNDDDDDDDSDDIYHIKGQL